MYNIIATLRDCINRQLKPLIGSDYVLWDLPYYANLGDIFIWQGELDFLRTLPYKCVNYASKDTCSFPNLSASTIILLQGGGNFGDLYLAHQKFRNKVIETYPHNRIIMFPQSVWYEDECRIEEDVRVFATHKNLYLCARDQWSYKHMKKHFSDNNILLVPDMAFFIDEARLIKYRNKSTAKKLYFKRLDKEYSIYAPLELGVGVDVHDWPTIEKESEVFSVVYKIYSVAKKLKKLPITSKILYSLSDRLAIIIKDKLVRQGCEFLSPYSMVVTTRLHAMILSILLHKPIEYIDNTTGKLSAFVDTWLSELETIKKYE